MIEIDIPGGATLRLSHLVADYNGTLACDGRLIGGLAELIRRVSAVLKVHVVTADTFGQAAEQLEALPVTVTILPAGAQDEQKAQRVRELGADEAVSLGNGRNDVMMLGEARLGICIIESEGACSQALVAANVVCRSASEALGLLLNPKRLMATLRT